MTEQIAVTSLPISKTRSLKIPHELISTHQNEWCPVIGMTVVIRRRDGFASGPAKPDGARLNHRL